MCPQLPPPLLPPLPASSTKLHAGRRPPPHPPSTAAPLAASTYFALVPLRLSVFHRDPRTRSDPTSPTPCAHAPNERHRVDVYLWLVVPLTPATANVSSSSTSGSPPARQPDVDSMTPPLDAPPTAVKGVYDEAAVSADSVQCAQIGRDILSIGGSAVDAAIATLLSVGVVNAHSMGLGGGFLMTVYERDSGIARVIDARETAPGLATENMFQGNLNMTLRGGLTVAVPGELRGYWEAHRRYGRLPWSVLFQPAIRICRDGHRIGFHMANALRVTRDHVLQERSLREIYVDPETGDVLKENDVVRRPVLAQTLDSIARHGADVLYTGELAAKLVDDLQKFGSIISLSDLASYRPLVKEPVEVDFANGLRLFSVPPPGSGALLGMILNVMDEYRPNAESVLASPDHLSLFYHRFIEACKFAYARRTQLGDQDFVDVSELLKNVTSKEFAQTIQKKIADNTTFDVDYYGAVLYQPDDYGTAHVAVVAPNGDAVSVTSSINQYFGAKIRSSSTGIIFNNVMGDFSAPNITSYFGLPPSPANFIRPGKRPLSSMCPAIFVDGTGEVVLAVGAAGGTRITSGTALVALKNLWMQEDIKSAIDQRRIHHQLFPQNLLYEKGFDEDMLAALERLGHLCKMYDTGGPIVVAVARQDDARLHAYSDARKGGGTAGF